MEPQAKPLGELISRYCVKKSTGIFSKGHRILQIYQSAISFEPLAVTQKKKAKKDKDLCYYFADFLQIHLQDKSELMIKLKQKSITVTCTERQSLYFDLCHYHEISKRKSNPTLFESYRGIYFCDVSDAGITMEVVMTLMTVGALLESKSGINESLKQRFIGFSEIKTIEYKESGDVIFNMKCGRCEKYKFEQAPEINHRLSSLMLIQSDSNKIPSIPEQSLIDSIQTKKQISKAIQIPIILRFDSDGQRLIEEHAKSHNLLEEYILTNINHLEVKRKTLTECTLIMGFTNGPQKKYQLLTEQLDYILCAIFHCLYHGKEGRPIEPPMILISPSQYNLKIYGLVQEASTEYENSVFLEIENKLKAESLNPYDLMLRKYIIDANFNAGSPLLSISIGIIELLFELLDKLEKERTKLEKDQASILAYKELLEKRKEEEKKEVNILNLGENPNAGKLLFYIYTLIPSLLSLIKKLIAMRNTPLEWTFVEKRLGVLISLLESRDSAIAYDSCSLLCEIFNVKKESGRRIEFIGSKKWLIKEIDGISAVFNRMAALLDAPPIELMKKHFQKEAPLSAHNSFYLHLYGMAHVIENFIIERKEIPRLEDQQYILNTILGHQLFLNVIEQICLMNSLPLVYQVTYTFYEAMYHIFSSIIMTNDNSAYLKRQINILKTTMIFFRQFHLFYTTSYAPLQKLSVNLCSLIIVNSPDCCDLMAKIIPRFVYKKVDPTKKLLMWKPEQWQDLFIASCKNIFSSTELWNEETRRELMAHTKDTINNYLMVKYTEGGDRIAWNYKEFEINYSSQKQKCKIGKYYLNVLLQNAKKPGEEEPNSLAEKITNPVKFWNKLIYAFQGTLETEKQLLILQMLRVVYKEYFQEIGIFRALPYFMNFLLLDSSQILFTPILKLIWTVMKADTVFLQNFNLFIEADGLTKLINVLCRGYNQKKKEKQSQKILRSMIILKIFKHLLKKTDLKFSFPEPKVRSFLQKDLHFETILHCLLCTTDLEMLKLSMKTIHKYFCEPHPLFDISQFGIIEFLFSLINEQTGLQAIKLLYDLQEACHKYNNVLDFNGQYTQSDLAVINRNTKLKQSVFLRYLPVPFTKYLLEKNDPKEFLDIYLNPDYSYPILIWKKEMRENLEKKINDHLQEYKEKLLKFVKLVPKKDRNINNMPAYKNLFRTVVKFPEIAHEVRCGEYYLRIWNKQPKESYDKIEQDKFISNLNATFKEFTEGEISTWKLADIKTILQTYKIVIRHFRQKPFIFACFPLMLGVLDKLCRGISEREHRVLMKIILKLIHSILKVNGNFSLFSDAGGCELMLSICHAWLYFLYTKRYLQMTLLDLRSVSWSLSVLSQVIENSPKRWGSMEYKSRENFLRKLFNFNIFIYEQVFKNEYKKSAEVPTAKIVFQLSDEVKIKKTVKKKENDELYSNSPISTIFSELAKAGKECDPYILSLYLQCQEITFNLLFTLSQRLESHKEIIISGFPYLALRLAFCSQESNYEYLKNWQDMPPFIGLAMMTLRHISVFAFTPLVSKVPLEPSIEMLKSQSLAAFKKNMTILVSEMVRNILMSNSEVSVSAAIVKEPGKKTLEDIMSQVHEKLHKICELAFYIWNKSTKTDLINKLNEILEFHNEVEKEITEEDLSKPVANFEYTALKSEIIIDGVFIRVLNKDPYGSIPDPGRFALAVVKELEKVNIPSDLAENSESLKRISDIIEALSVVAIYQKGIDHGLITIQNVTLICKFLFGMNMPLGKENPQNNTAPLKYMERIYNSIFSILIEACKNTKSVKVLLSNINFNVTLFQSLCTPSHENFRRKALECIDGIISLNEYDDNLYQHGYFVALAKLAFDNVAKIDTKMRLHAFLLFQITMSRQKAEAKYKSLLYLIPGRLIEKISIKNYVAKSDSWLNLIDNGTALEQSPEKPMENITKVISDIYLVYNKALHERITYILNQELSSILSALATQLQSLPASEKVEKNIWNMPSASLIAPYINEGEIVVQEIILTEYIKSPSGVTFIAKKPFTKFLESLTAHIIQCLQLFSKYRTVLISGKSQEAQEEPAKLPPPEKKQQQVEEDKAVASKPSAPIDNEKHDMEPNVDFLQKGVLCYLTALLIALEQSLNNPFSSCKKSVSDLFLRKSYSGSKEVSAQIQSQVANLFGGRDSFENLVKLGLKSCNSREINVTMMELIILLLDHKEINMDVDDLVLIAKNVVQCFIDHLINEQKKFEYALLFIVLLKIADRLPPGVKGKHPILDVFMEKDFLVKLQLTYPVNPYIKKYIEILFSRICKASYYSKLLINEMKYEISPDFKLSNLVKDKKSEAKEIKLWRLPPSSDKECEKYYSFINLKYMEDVADIEKLGLFEGGSILPLVSKNIYDQKKFSDAFKNIEKKYGDKGGAAEGEAAAGLGQRRGSSS